MGKRPTATLTCLSASSVRPAVLPAACVTGIGQSTAFGKLFDFAGGDRAAVKRAALFGSWPPKNDSTSSATRKGIGRYLNFYNTRGLHLSDQVWDPEVMYFALRQPLTEAA